MATTTASADVAAKIRKLLRLSQSANEHEAALAAAHAQRRLDEHHVDKNDLARLISA